MEQNKPLGTAPFLIIQDADLEYDPSEYPILLQPLLENRADVVFGSRFMGGHAHRVLYFWHSVGNTALTLLSNMFTNLNPVSYTHLTLPTIYSV